MARKKSATLTDAELRLMEILWRQGESSVNDVVTALPADLNLAYNTVLTTLRILERKGFVTHAKSGRAHLYRPLVDRTEARRTAVAYMLRRFFDNSPEALALHILENEDISEDELRRVKKLVEGEGK